MSNPKVTVLMPVYNAEKYVGEAIESILNQTFKDFEFLIINDGSTDKSLDVINSYSDPRIRVVNNETNLGLSPTLNKGIDLSNGEYIARMDADDISLPTRLLKQSVHMDKHPEIGICGTWIEGFGNPLLCGIWKTQKNHDELLCNLMYGSSFAHPSVILRKSILIKYQSIRYEDFYTPCEDYRLWYSLLKVTKGANLQEVLLCYRRERDSNQMSEYMSTKIVTNTDCVRLDIVVDLLGGISESDKSFHIDLLNKVLPSDVNSCRKTVNWIISIIDANKMQKIFPEPTFRKKAARFLFAKLYSSVGNKAFNYLFTYPKFLLSVEKLYVIAKPFQKYFPSKQ